ncbi:pyridoxamine 5'-phosphate oxidase family protein [Propionicicella superfundia]|uniref:pyridoxamine 5'-phosphate oxidase family protein n=1 Tax=Propionicicella superfundia TaxID=348582 RepID=UPI000688773C|nr:pyridoxamine 5'-phosphate oxidase family protein [Propionicicella superfundia]
MSSVEDEGTFERLDPAECEHLVRGVSVGRVAWLSRRGLQVLPVRYTVADGKIYFRTSSESILAELTTLSEVAVQIDDIDTDTASGWSVLVQGEARVSSTPPGMFPEPWAPGPRNVVVEIIPRSYSGRAVSAGGPATS